MQPWDDILTAFAILDISLPSESANISDEMPDDFAAELPDDGSVLNLDGETGIKDELEVSAQVAEEESDKLVQATVDETDEELIKTMDEEDVDIPQAEDVPDEDTPPAPEEGADEEDVPVPEDDEEEDEPVEMPDADKGLAAMGLTPEQIEIVKANALEALEEA